MGGLTRADEQGGSAIRRGIAGTLMCAAVLLGSTTTALADPGFRLTESTAGPGDTVHFAISDADDVKRFTISVAGQTIVESGNKHRENINGTFTMPDLGGSTRTVTVEAKLKEDRKSVV